MKAPTLAYARGYVKVNIRGESMESFINSAVSNQVNIWDVQRNTWQSLQCNILLPDYFKLRPLLKKTDCRIHVEQRIGWPFMMKRVFQRKFFLSGFIFFVLGLYMLSSIVWSIEVKGNVRVPTEQIIAVAKEEGVYLFQWKFRLRDPNQIAKAIHKRFKELSWIGVNWEGTKVSIQVIEATKPEVRKLLNPRHLVAKADAVITNIIVEKGRALAKRNERVKRGDVLISGKIGTGEEPTYVAARGEVKGLVWHIYNISSPLVIRQKVYTGQKIERKYIVIGKRRLRVTGFKDMPYKNYEQAQEKSIVQWGGVISPISWVTEKIKEVQFILEERSVERAAGEGLKQARADVLARNGSDARVHMEKILHQKMDNGKVVMKVLFEVEQPIAEELLLVRQFD